MIEPAVSRARQRIPVSGSSIPLLFPTLLVPLVATALATFPLGIWWLAASVLGEGIDIWTLFRGVAAERPDPRWNE